MAKQNRFVSTNNTHSQSGEWDFEDHGPDAGPSVLVVPNGALLPAITFSAGELFFVSGSGVMAISKDGVWQVASGAMQSRTVPVNALLHFPQSGFSLNTTPFAYPSDEGVIDAWFISSESSGTNMTLVQGGVEPTFDDDLGFGASDYDGTKYLRRDAASEIAPGNSDVATIGIALRLRTDPSGTFMGLTRMLTDGGGFNLGMTISNSGVLNMACHDGTANRQSWGTTELKAANNYTVIGVLKADGTRKIFLNGADDTFNDNGAFAGLLRSSIDIAIAASTPGGASPLVSGLLLDVSYFYRDFEDTGELETLHNYLTDRFSSLDGS